MSTLAHVSCKYFDRLGGACCHKDRRWFFGRYRRRCGFVASRGESCRLKEPLANQAVKFKDATIHGPCVDTDGNEWEISAVTSTDIVVTVWGADGRSLQTHVPKDSFLRRLMEQEVSSDVG